MGCGGHKQKRRPSRSAHADPIAANSKKEIEEIAELPLRAKDEETDLISMVEVSIKCGEVVPISKTGLPKTFVVFFKETSDAHPEYVTTFCTAYSFEKQQRVGDMQLKFELYDVHQLVDRNVLTRQALLGDATLSIHELVCSPTQSLTKELQSPTIRKKLPGLITISTEAVGSSNEVVLMTWEYESPAAIDRVYIRIVRVHEDGARSVPVYESEIRSESPARWKRLKLTLDTLCKGDQSRPISLEIYRSHPGKERQLLGTAATSIADMRSHRSRLAVDVVKDDSPIGKLKLVDFDSLEESSFLDFVYGGCEISLIIGIDFTKSNGNPSERSSLHYMDATHPNEYVQAITEVGDILQYYDSDKRIPVFGFGAKLPPAFTHVSHCFALNGDIFDPEVQGIGRVVEVYRSMCKEVNFHGPTMFSPLIHMAAEYAAARKVTQSAQHYYILLILTDGIINDMDQTLREIVDASELPISIIIVGIGPENFEMMKVLDGDDKSLFSKLSKKTAERDIVQFVPFQEVKANQLELARQVLYEIPKQLLTFMNKRGIRANLSRDTEPRSSGFSNVGALTPKKRVHLPPLIESPRDSPFEAIKQRFIEEMVSLGCDREALIEELQGGLLCIDAPYTLEVLSSKGPGKLKPALRKEKRREKRTASGKVVRMASDEEQICRVCRKLPINTILVECGHRVVCQTCALGLTNKECPVCRKMFARWVLTYDV